MKHSSSKYDDKSKYEYDISK